MDLLDSAILFVLVTIVTTWLVAFAYKNTKFVLKHKIAQKREDAIAKDVLKVVNDDKKMGKKEKDERVLCELII
jgi:translocon-associated protein subunit gamma